MVLNGGLGLGMVFWAKDLASGTMTDLERRWKSLDVTVSQSADHIADSFSRLKQGVAAFTAGALIVGGISSVGMAAFKASAQMETYTTSFTTLLGSAEAAQAHLAELREFATQTPFEFVGLADASKQLQAYGFAAKDVIPILTQIGDASAALGGGLETQSRLIRALGQIQARGQLAMQEVLQIGETGVPIFKILQEELGLTAEQVGDIGKQGVAASKAIPAILAGIQKRYAGLMEARSKTAEGMISNIADAWHSVKLDIGVGFFDSAKGVIADVKRMVESLDDSDALRGFGQGLGALTNLIRPIVGGIGAIVQGIGNIAAKKPYVLEFTTALIGVAAVTATIVGGIAALRAGLTIVGAMMRAAGIAGMVSWGGLIGPIAAVTAAIMLLKLAYDNNFAGFRDFVDRAKLVWNGFWSLVSSAKLTANGLVGSMPEELYNRLQKAGLLPWVTGLFQAFTRLRAFAVGAAQAISGAWSVVSFVVGGVLDVIRTGVEFVSYILDAFGLDVLKVGNAPSSESWRVFGQVLTTVLGIGWAVAKFGAVRGAISGAVLQAQAFGAQLVLLRLRMQALPGRMLSTISLQFDALRVWAIHFGDAVVRAGVALKSWSMARFAQVQSMLASLWAGVVRLGTGLVTVGKAWMQAGLAGLRAGLMWLASPVGLVVVGIAALIAGLVLLVRNWDTVKAAAASVWERFISFANNMPGWVAGLLAIFAPVIGIPVLIIRNWESIVTFIRSIPSRVADIGGKIVDMIVNGIKNAAGAAIKGLGWLGGQIAGLFGLSSKQTAVLPQMEPKANAVSWVMPQMTPALAGGGSAPAIKAVPPATIAPSKNTTIAKPSSPVQTAAAIQQAVVSVAAQQAQSGGMGGLRTVTRTPVQLVLGKRVVAETVIEHNEEEVRRQGRW